jgi:hypothetical protein
VAYALLTIFVVAWLIGFAALAVGVWNLVRVPFNLKADIDVWASGNPLNYLLRPEALTARGLIARRRVGQALLVFIAACAVALAAGFVAKWIS